MRRIVAAAVMLVFAWLMAVDSFSCPDGCTHEQQASAAQHGQSNDGSCMLCVGGIDSAAPPALSPSGTVADSVGFPPLKSHLDAVAKPPDHPPRV